MKVRLAIQTGKRRAYGIIDGPEPGCVRQDCHYFDYDEEPGILDRLSGQKHKCDKCGTEFIPHIFGFVYNTPSGELEPGCLFWTDWLPEDYYWDNHKGPHLYCVLPNGNHWNIDGRASNCTMPNDRTHRCWVRHGEPPNIHVDKNGLTCAAGAGSIQSGDYHGFLHHGELT